MEIENVLCTGCAACSQKCPKKCITMEMNAEGFRIPVIDKQTCVNCGLCEETCPILNINVREKRDMSIYGCKLKDEEDLWKSTSGGAFYALGQMIIKRKGVVFGAAYDVNMEVEHIGIDNIKELDRLRKSKYVQSDIKDTYREAENYLNDGKWVLYSGTPCQIAGLNSYLKREYSNLLRIEVFCHSISSPGVWRDYLHKRENENGTKVVAVDFRAKARENGVNEKYGIAKSGWKNPYFILEFQNGRKFIEKMESNLFLKGFSNGLSTRLSCHDCKFKLLMNTSGTDFSLGDFWGIETVDSTFFDEKGISVMVCHTDSARLCVEELQKDMEMRQFYLNDVLPGNKELCNSAPKHINRTLFFKEYSDGNKDVDELLQKNLGFFAAHPSLTFQIGLLGSHNTRRAINTICAGSKCNLSYQFSNMSLISMFSEECRLPINIKKNSNPFRTEMLKADWDKSCLKNIDNFLNDTDILCIDFLEERFDIVKWDNSFVTKSDAYMDAEIESNDYIERTSEYCVSLWKTSALKFLSILKQMYDLNKVIIIKQFLCEEYGNFKERYPFLESENIKKTNQMLEECYDYFIQESKIKNVIEITNNTVRFSDQNHRHGCIPCHTNAIHNNQLAELLYKKIIEILVENH